MPAPGWLRGRTLSDLSRDFSAAVITAMPIPQGMAYAPLAGLPPRYGLYLPKRFAPPAKVSSSSLSGRPS
ncbi:MAG: SulP family inorganic anion transporter [Rubrobacteraceae bacterium]